MIAEAYHEEDYPTQVHAAIARLERKNRLIREGFEVCESTRYTDRNTAIFRLFAVHPTNLERIKP